MKSKNANVHLTLEERKVIERGIENNSTKTAIAITLGKDNSTIGKEISQHRVITFQCALPLECANYKKCKYNRNCKQTCPDYKKYKCKRRDRSPGACNGCSNFSHCRFTKYKYQAITADYEYKEKLVSSRVGFDLNENDIDMLSSIVVPLINQGLSPYSIVQAHPELNICEKTLYTYIDGGVFKDVKNIDLRRKVSMKVKKQYTTKKREDRKYLEGRKYADYLEYVDINEISDIVEMDTVYNCQSGPYIQTFKFVKYSFLFAIYHTEKTTEAMNYGVEVLYDILGDTLFKKYVKVILTDRGGEFIRPNEIEKAPDDSVRTRVFYCDPMCSNQKGSIENNHKELRYICPKECDLYQLGLTSQKALNTVLSNINSFKKENINGKTPFEYLQFLAPELSARFISFGIKNIENQDNVILKSYLLKPFKK